MAWTKLKLYNGAVRICGERKTTLAEEREPRRLLDDVWDDDIIKTCLEKGQWQFATRTAQLEKSSSVSPTFGYSYAFEKPSDYIRTVMLSADEFFSEPMTQFADETNYIFAEIDPIYFAYVSDDESYGRDLSLWPQSFGRYVQSELALEIAPRLKGTRTDVVAVEEERDRRLNDAQDKDGVNRPTRFPSRGAWNQARHGRYARHTDRRR